MDYISAKEAARRWGVDTSRIGKFARDGRIEGAKIVGRNWLIPQNAKKPSDGRTRSAKAAEKAPFFRFPLYINEEENRFSPPLSGEEALVRKAQLDYYACSFDSAQKVFDRLAKGSESNSLKIISLFYLCSLSVEVFGGENFGFYFEQLQLALAVDFPHKKDMAVVLPWLYIITVQLPKVSEALHIDPLYDYSPTVQPLFAYLSFYHLSKGDPSKSNDASLDVYEMLVRHLVQSGHLYEACELHFALFLGYYVSMKKEAMLHHLREGLTLAKEHKLYLIAASYEFYYRDAFDVAFREFPEDFVKLIKRNAAIISKSFGKFTQTYNNTDIYTALSIEDYRYLVLALQGITNKEIAESMQLSQRTVATHLAAIYEKLGVSGKQELISLFAESQ